MTTQAARQVTTPQAATGQAQNAVDLFRARVAASSQHVALRHKEGGTWRALTWADWDTASREIAGGLRALGLEIGDRVCLIANTRYEWVLADVGILMAGSVTVPIYQSSTPEQCEYIINDCGAKVVIAEDPSQLEKFLDPSVREKLAGVSRVVLMSETAHLEKPDAKNRLAISLAEVLPEGHADRKWVTTLAELRSEGRAFIAKNPGVLEAAWDEVRPDHVFTIVYTSGTTGPPKGAVLTHSNIVFECTAMSTFIPMDEQDEQLLFLPLAHIFAKLLEWIAIAKGASTAFAESIPKLVENMKETRPTFMGAVPRVYEKAYGKIQQGLAEKRKKPVAKAMIDWALDVGRRVSQERQAGREPQGLLALQNKLATKLVLGNIQATFGGRIRWLISGGAPLSREIAEFFHAAGILILEGYGLTETTAATHANRLEAFRFGSVGLPLPGVEVKVADDGEILVRGGNILKEYYRKPDATREAIDGDGWFHTGDIGVVEDGFLRITDRKKDIIVTAGGKNVAPQNIESALKSLSPLISQVVVHGDQRPYLVALITLNEENVVPWARQRGIQFTGASELASKPEVKAEIQRIVDQLNARQASFETIKKYEILPRDFTLETGELTPSLKVKRKFVSEKHRALLDAMY